MAEKRAVDFTETKYGEFMKSDIISLLSSTPLTLVCLAPVRCPADVLPPLEQALDPQGKSDGVRCPPTRTRYLPETNTITTTPLRFTIPFVIPFDLTVRPHIKD